MRRIPLAFALLFALLAAPLLAGSGKDDVFPLLGVTLPVKLTAGERSDIKRGAEDLEETWVFGEKTVKTSALAARGFAEVPYTVKKDGKKWVFRAEATSPTAGKLVWTGDYREEWFEGVVVLQPLAEGKERPELNYGFSVKRPKPKK